jgi:hypothetical protein
MLVFGNRAIGHPNPVGMAFLDHHGDTLRQEYARLEIIADSSAASQKVPGDLIGLLRSRTSVVIEDDFRHHDQSVLGGIVPTPEVSIPSFERVAAAKVQMNGGRGVARPDGRRAAQILN